MLHMGSKMKQFMFIEIAGMHSLYNKLAMCKCACLVEHYSAKIGQCVHISTALDKYSPTRCSPDTTKERQRYTDDQGARTRDNKEYQCSIQPCGEGCGITICREEWRNEGQCQSRKHYYRGIDTRKTGDERLTARLVLIGTLHKSDYLGYSALAKCLCSLNTYHSRKIDAT